VTQRIISTLKIETYKNYNIYKIRRTAEWPHRGEEISIEARPKGKNRITFALSGYLETNQEIPLISFLLKSIKRSIDGKGPEYQINKQGDIIKCNA